MSKPSYGARTRRQKVRVRKAKQLRGWAEKYSDMETYRSLQLGEQYVDKSSTKDTGTRSGS